MGDNDPIDISSDSDVEEVGAQIRTLPDWAFTGAPSSSVARNGSGTFVKSRIADSSGGGAGSERFSSQRIASNGNGNFVNFRIANSSGVDIERLSSQQALRRTLASHLRLPGSVTGSDGTWHDGSTYLRDTYGLVSLSPTSSSRFHDAYGNLHNYDRGSNGVSMAHGPSGRVLPSTMQDMPLSSMQYGAASDSTHRSGLGNDERLIFQAALQDLNQPKFEATLPDGLLSVPLLRHQKIALAWMLQRETRSLHCLGGILADDQGLGKTVSMIALIQIQKASELEWKSEGSRNKETEALNLDDDEPSDPKSSAEPKIEALGREDTKSLILNGDNDNNGESASDKIKNGKSTFCDSVSQDSASVRTISRRRPAAGTLVVSPASVLRQWAQELNDKASDEAKLSVLVYHGGHRTKDPVELAKYDVVLTTYAIVTNEVPKQPLVDEDEADEKSTETNGVSSPVAQKRKKNTSDTSKKRRKKGKMGIDDASLDYDCGPLARVGWFRVILDEAQTIKNHQTQVARACCSLRAKRRWCLSGTPIQNRIDDLYSYFRFLKYDPYAVYKSFCHTIKGPISKNSFHGYKKLQAVLRAIMLRRTKGTFIDGEPIIKLPPKSVHLRKVNFSAEERAFYRQLEADSRSQFKAYAAAGTVNQNYANILLMLLRLRQACDHPLLVKGYNADVGGKVPADMVKRISKETSTNLLDCLHTSFAICRLCNDSAEDPIVTICGHVFCYQCVSEYLTGDDNTCPVSRCKQQLGHDVVFSEATLRKCISGDLHDSLTDDQSIELRGVSSEHTSSKIRAVIEILNLNLKQKSYSLEENDFSEVSQVSPVPSDKCNTESWRSDSVVRETTVVSSTSRMEGPIKSIVFSQWTGMLDLVEMALNENCIQYRRLDGTMSLAARDRAVKDFNNDPEVTVMLMSLKAGNLGLNMVAACHVILLDLWWNPTTEDQAVDRAHRIGQTRPVTVTRLTIRDTVEDRILALQEEKRKMVASAFGEENGGGAATKLTVDDLKYLFRV